MFRRRNKRPHGDVYSLFEDHQAPVSGGGTLLGAQAGPLLLEKCANGWISCTLLALLRKSLQRNGAGEGNRTLMFIPNPKWCEICLNQPRKRTEDGLRIRALTLG